MCHAPHSLPPLHWPAAACEQQPLCCAVLSEREREEKDGSRVIAASRAVAGHVAMTEQHGGGGGWAPDTPPPHPAAAWPGPRVMAKYLCPAIVSDLLLWVGFVRLSGGDASMCVRLRLRVCD